MDEAPDPEALIKARGEICEAGKVLYLVDCSLGPSELRALEPELRGCQCVEELILASNRLGPEGVRVVAGLVPHLPRLKRLWLNGNALGDKGARAMAAVLREPSCSITMLGLGFNGITDEGARVLAAALRRNDRLKMLYVFGKYIGTDGLRALCGAMESNVTLQELNLDGNPCVQDKPLINALNAALKRNKELAPLVPVRRSNCRAVLVALMGVRKFRGVWKRLDRRALKHNIAMLVWYEMRHNAAWDQ